ncbi:flagellar motor protein MotB [Shimia sp. SDUM112013]|uniref:flagellar motor protein MotB n=1 Tax=Shimia sp. SDUM112013 TaxID=3136160 RepID=UPI0032EDF09E
MSGSTNVAPVIIKRKKTVKGEGHHGGAWKVAYADFVTAMMAFFMLMWLLNATTEKQRKGIADYFSPTVPINRISGGGEGMFGGSNVFEQQLLARNGRGGLPFKGEETGQPAQRTVDQEQQDAEAQKFGEVEEFLLGNGGESLIDQNSFKHVTSRLTDEGLVIELFDREGSPLFVFEGDAPTRLLVDLIRTVARASLIVQNNIAVEGHVAAEPVVRAEKAVWPLSARRAESVRKLLEAHGISPDRMQRVTGHADKERKFPDPLDARHNRIEVILLRKQ